LIDEQVLERLRGVKDVDAEYEDILEAARQSRLIKSPYANILKKKYRPQFIIACIFMFFQQFDVSLFHAIQSAFSGKPLATFPGCMHVAVKAAMADFQVSMAHEVIC
jgi:hypothetical protein